MHLVSLPLFQSHTPFNGQNRGDKISGGKNGYSSFLLRPLVAEFVIIGQISSKSGGRSAERGDGEFLGYRARYRKRRLDGQLERVFFSPAVARRN